MDEVDAVLSVLSDLLKKPRDELPSYSNRLRGFLSTMSRGETVKPEAAEEIGRLEAVWAVMTQEAWPSFVANKLDILKMPDDLLEAVRESELSYTKAVALHKVKNPTARAYQTNSEGRKGCRCAKCVPRPVKA